jgi:predicted transcriptional regulator
MTKYGSMVDDKPWDDIAFVRRSGTRRKILEHLQKAPGPLTPTDLAERLEKNMKNVSRELSGLNDSDLVECVNPDAANMRMYRLTDHGTDILAEVTAIENDQSEYRD